MIFTRADVPAVQKLVFPYLETYYSTMEDIVNEYPQAESVIPRPFLSHARNVRLLVTPTAFVAYVYEGDKPWTAEWVNAGITEVASEFPGFDRVKAVVSKWTQENPRGGYKATAHPEDDTYFDIASESASEDISASKPPPLSWERAILSDDRIARHWTANDARQEAQSDIIATTLGRLMGSQFSQSVSDGAEGDPKKAVAQELNRLIGDFEALLADARREEEVQVFIKEHPYLLDLRAIAVDPKVPLGSEYVTDFVVTLPGNEHLLVELERPSHPLYTKTYNPAAPLTHAVRQVEDWLEWAYENLGYLRSRYPDIHEPKGLVVLGRRSSLDPKAAKALRRRNVLSKVRVATYDDLIDEMKSIAYNLERGTIPTSAGITIR